MTQKSEGDKKKMNPVLWFLVAIVLPVMFVLFLIGMILMMAGVDVMGWAEEKASHIPVVSETFSNEEPHDQQEANELREKMNQKDEKIESLKGKISLLESNVDELKQRQTKLNNQKDYAEDDNKEETSEHDPMGDIASSFSDMDNEQAARVLQAMEQKLAISILEELPNDARSDIFNAMDADYAATLTKGFVNQTE